MRYEERQAPPAFPTSPSFQNNQSFDNNRSRNGFTKASKVLLLLLSLLMRMFNSVCSRVHIYRNCGIYYSLPHIPKIPVGLCISFIFYPLAYLFLFTGSLNCKTNGEPSTLHREVIIIFLHPWNCSPIPTDSPTPHILISI